MYFIEDTGTGYLYCYDPDHYCANKAGKVLEHVYIMAEHIGRKLEKHECVHHVDRDRKNNNIENLRLMTRSEHGMLHAKEDKGYIPATQYKQCQQCSKDFLVQNNSKQKFCSSECTQNARLKFDITKEELLKLVWELPTSSIAKMLNVSDTAIAKRCRKFGISKPPRGYWAKQAAHGTG